VSTTRKAATGTLLASALLASGLISLSIAPAQAAAAPPVKRFTNCTAMHKVFAYRGGIKRVGAHDRRSSGVAKYTPYVSTKRYKLNAFSDRDKDGVACEA
jgi:Excalibur calcium-binding domain